MSDRTSLGICRRLAAVIAAGLSVPLGGCQSSAQTGALTGAGLGALVGQVAGGDTEATLIGAAVGTGVGYIIGNEMDKKQAEEMERSAPPAAPRGSHSEVGSLGGTEWTVVSIVPADATEPFSSKVVSFGDDGFVDTTTTAPDGSVTRSSERFRVVGSTLIVNADDYMINARFDISGDQLVVSAEEFSAVLQRLR